jgi:hypothetical protein
MPLTATHVLPTGIVEKRVVTPRGMIDFSRAQTEFWWRSLKDGAATDTTVGRIGQTEAKMFRKGMTENLPSIITWSIEYNKGAILAAVEETLVFAGLEIRVRRSFTRRAK